jgi:CheY-like chemotaxis protein
MASSPPSVTELPTHFRHHVLVVDDFQDTRDAIVSLLATKGFEATGADSGPSALDHLQAGMRPCVVVLDVRMPGMDGWQVWDRIKHNDELAQVSRVILSADVADDKRARAVGIREFLRKPVSGKALVAAIERHCGHPR